MKAIVRRPSPALGVALVALFVALGGSSYAAIKVGTKQIANNSVRSTDLRNNNVRGKDVRKNTLTGADVAESKLGKVKSAGKADDAGTVGGQSAASLAEPRAYGYLNASAGTVALDPAFSKGIDAVSRHSTGTYCLDVAFTPKTISAIPEYIGGGATTMLHASVPVKGNVCGGHDALVRVTNSNGTAIDTTDTYVQLH